MTTRTAVLENVGRTPIRRRPHIAGPAILILVVLMVGASLMTAVAAGSGGGSVDSGGSVGLETEFFDLLNDARNDNGMKSLNRVEGVTNVAREWSVVMAEEQRLYHRPDLAGPFTGSWRGLGENVGVGYGPKTLHKAFMDSPGHYANIMGNYDHVGVSVALAGDRLWVTFNFVRSDPATASKYNTNPLSGNYATGSGTSGPFYDISNSVHNNDIKGLDAAGIAISCAETRYCPGDPLLRAEMAVLLVRTFKLPPATERFSDVSSSHPYAAEIGALAAAGITKGCNPPANDRFCPEDPVTRQQMASFFVRAMGMTKVTSTFRDVSSGNVHAKDIGALGKSGITLGCNPPNNDRFCPQDAVSRAQMASFIQRARS